jgi:hypothetical protein
VPHITLKKIHSGSTDSSIKTISKKNLGGRKRWKKYIGSLIDIALKLSDENRILGKRTENSNITLDHASAAQCRYCACPKPHANRREASPPAAPEANENKPRIDVFCTGSTSHISPPGIHGNPGAVHVTPAYS